MVGSAKLDHWSGRRDWYEIREEGSRNWHAASGNRSSWAGSVLLSIQKGNGMLVVEE